MSQYTDKDKEDALAAVKAAGQARAGAELKEGEALDYESQEGNHYTGVIVFKKPSMGDIMKMGAIKSEILRESGVRDPRFVDDDIMFMAQVISTLEVVMYKRPECLLKLREITEADLLFHVYGLYEMWEASFRKAFREASANDRPAADGKETMDTP
ncbi:hypothetical protein [Paenibacillus shenyangensis]|uniref:hypothetical protein n=1 Tax=Paenibacillus sp. A9 TaxID=1284352 RepID=UPI00036C1C98|nr:hypothetical protein [Paenibacillus sp. A9]